ncbi:hypothetical protein [Niveibacterium sp. SC-1]|uniref:hypothetical protein n=1 Tax=Niveibacterium sp. SC-1 TaxID=3135646 RepID=UPI00311E21E5
MSHSAFLRRLAQRQLKALKSGSPAQALPVLRRLQQVGLFAQTPLSKLFHERSEVQLKHLLRMLALELGYPDWESLAPVVESLPAERFDGPLYRDGGLPYPSPWFRDEAEALAWQAEHGGTLHRYGDTVVVVAEPGQASPDD